jgi:hypothetical protein
MASIFPFCSPFDRLLSERSGTAMTEQETVGTYFQQRIEQRKRQVAKTRNAAGYVAMWPEAVKDVLARFPNLSNVEKSALRSNVENQIQLFCMRRRRSSHEFAGALNAVARLLWH